MEHRTLTGAAGRPAPLRRLCRALAELARRVARLLVPRWIVKQLPAPARWLGSLFLPGRKRGFGYWWLVLTLGIAAAIGMVVALLVSPVAGLVALLVVAGWAVVRHARGARARRTSRSSEPASGSSGRPAMSSRAAEASATRAPRPQSRAWCTSPGPGATHSTSTARASRTR